MDKAMIAVIAGTSEAYEVIEALCRKYIVCAYVATEIGMDMLKNLDCMVYIGRLDYYGFKNALSKYHAVIDATHPFAVEVSENVRLACKANNIPYMRYRRKSETYSYDNIIWAENKEEAVQILNTDNKNIFFTTGIKTFKFYSEHVVNFKQRAAARILNLPSHNEFEKNIIRAKPPFSIEDNIRHMKACNAEIMVSKDSGEKGGVFEKIAACQILKLPILLIKAPYENVRNITIDELEKLLDAKLKSIQS
ncbi:MAG: precorrin-6A/cobalt-precorrin-6A reductase [Clostridia bacterium]|nr:precorrin-6A/cobalt-precorrin-6A reductase [Clostridia bacterium]